MTSSKEATQGSTALATATTLGVYERTIITVIDGLVIKTDIDQAVAHRFIEFTGMVFTQKRARDAVIGSLNRLRKRLVAADLPRVGLTVSTLDKAVSNIETQPDKMSTTNGHDSSTHYSDLVASA